MSCPFDVNHGIIHSLPLKLEMTAEGVHVELQLTAHSGIIRDIMEDMDLMVYVLYIFKRRE